jgi:hypothetical protein
VTGDLTGVLAGIHAAVHELTDLIDTLRELLPERGTGGPEVSTARRPPGSRPPWDSPAANAYLAIHAWAREAEADLGTYVHGRYYRRPAGSDRVTKDALAAVAMFCDDSRVPEVEVRRIARHLGTLLRAAQSVPAIDAAPPAALLLRQPCPSCGTGALVAPPGTTEIRCDDDQACAASWTKDRWPALLAALWKGTA